MTEYFNRLFIHDKWPYGWWKKEIKGKKNIKETDETDEGAVEPAKHVGHVVGLGAEGGQPRHDDGGGFLVESGGQGALSRHRRRRRRRRRRLLPRPADGRNAHPPLTADHILVLGNELHAAATTLNTRHQQETPIRKRANPVKVRQTQ